jgi:hypothetical protein
MVTLPARSEKGNFKLADGSKGYATHQFIEKQITEGRVTAATVHTSGTANSVVHLKFDDGSQYVAKWAGSAAQARQWMHGKGLATRYGGAFTYGSEAGKVAASMKPEGYTGPMGPVRVRPPEMAPPAVAATRAAAIPMVGQERAVRNTFTPTNPSRTNLTVPQSFRDALRELTGGQVSAEQFANMFGIDGHTLDFTATASKKPNGTWMIETRATAKDADGKVSLTGTRSFYQNGEGEFEVHHDYLRIAKAHQGGGKAGKLYDNLMVAYKKMGVKVATMQCNCDVGGYTWAGKGFNFRDSSQRATVKAYFSNHIEGTSSAYGGRRGLDWQQIDPNGTLDDVGRKRFQDSLREQLVTKRDAVQLATFTFKNLDGSEYRIKPINTNYYTGDYNNPRTIEEAEAVHFGKAIMLGTNWHGTSRAMNR